MPSSSTKTPNPPSLGLLWERHGFLALPVIILLPVWLLIPIDALLQAAGELSSSLIPVFAIAVGFTATTKSILLALQDRRFMRQLRELGRDADIYRYFLSAIRWGFAAAALSAALSAAFATAMPYTALLALLWSYIILAATLDFLRALRVFGLILADTRT